MSTQAPRRQIISTKAALEARSKRRNLIAIASLIVLAIVAIVALVLANRVPESASTAPINSTLKVGDKAPDFTLSTTGGPFQLATSETKPTVLEVFATWCPHCQREASVLSSIYDQYKGRINMVGVNGSPQAIDGQSAETQVDVVDWAQKYNAQYPVAFDPDLSVAKKYLQGGFPTVVLIGTDGKVQGIRSGEMPRGDITKAIEAALAGKKPDANIGAKAEPAPEPAGT